MKIQTRHTLFFVLSGIMLLIAGSLTYSEFAKGFDARPEVLPKDDSEDICLNLPDSTRFIARPCFEYSKYQHVNCRQKGIKDEISKTIVSVSGNGFDLKSPESGSIKSIPANRSLNIMMETYTVTRKSDSCDVYIVAIESFSTTMERIDRSINYLKPSAHLPENSDLEQLRQFLNNKGTSASIVDKYFSLKHY